MRCIAFLVVFRAVNFDNNVVLFKTAPVSLATATMPTEVPAPWLAVEMPSVIALFSESVVMLDVLTD